MPVTEQQARAIAFLAVAARPRGAAAWDEAGVLANVRKIADRSLPGVVIAVMQAAEDRGATTPGVIPTAGPHWRDPGSAPPPTREPYDRETYCGVCSEPRARCEQIWAGDHEFESVARAGARPEPDNEADVAYAREAIAEAKAIETGASE